VRRAAITLATALALSSGSAMSADGPPAAARLDCSLNNGDADYAVACDFDDPDIVVSRGGDSVPYRRVGMSYYDNSVIVAASHSGDAAILAMFVMGDQNQISYFRDGTPIETHDCTLIDAEYLQ
jgi:hypothetical protein